MDLSAVVSLPATQPNQQTCRVAVAERRSQFAAATELARQPRC
jgi:hypothetical protein